MTAERSKNEQLNIRRPAAHMVTPHDRGVAGMSGVVPEAEQAALAAGLGGELRRLRKAAGLTQAQTAGLAGMDRGTVGRFERGQLRPTIPALAALARTLAPRDAASATLEALTTLAGGSARDARERRRYRAESRAHRETLARVQATVETLQRAADPFRRAGRPVPAQIIGLLKPLEAHLPVLRERLLPELPPEQDGRRGLTPAAQELQRMQAMPKSVKGMLAWYADREADRESAPQPLTSTNTSDAHDVNTPEHLPNTIQEA